MMRWPQRLMRYAKPLLAKFMCSSAIGALIASFLRNRIRNRGIVIDTSPSAFTSVVKAQLAFGIYESAEIRFIRKYLKGYSRVLELGASLGVTAAHILDVVAPGAEWYASKPIPIFWRRYGPQPRQQPKRHALR